MCSQRGSCITSDATSSNHRRRMESCGFYLNIAPNIYFNHLSNSVSKRLSSRYHVQCLMLRNATKSQSNECHQTYSYNLVSVMLSSNSAEQHLSQPPAYSTVTLLARLRGKSTVQMLVEAHQFEFLQNSPLRPSPTANQ